MAWEPYAESRRTFERDTAEHKVNVIRDDGVYRHLRCNKPGTWNMGFDIITWPGYLVITGDVETYVFSRCEDMFNWFGDDPPRREINPGYWSQKLKGDRLGRDISRSYSHEAFSKQMHEWVRMECESAEYDGDEMYESLLREAVDREVLAEYTTYEEEARERILDLQHEGIVTGETWEWDLKDYDYFFLWCCHAILWAIREYDALAAPEAVAA
jgi:hypothetical protein